MSSLAVQFCVEIAFGVLLALAFVPRAPVGSLFYRLMGTAALVPLLLAGAAPLSSGTARWTDPAVLATLVAIAAYPVYSGPVRGRRWALGLAAGLLGSASAVVLILASEGLPGGPLALPLASLTALSTGAVAGSVGVAMVLGHWYLTVPNLQVRHLARLNRLTIASMVLTLVLVGVSFLVFGEDLAGREPALASPWGLFHLGSRVAVGLLMPLVFAWMAASSLRFENTRSATGILYASTVLVLIGTAVSVSLQRSYGIPL